MPAFMDAPLLHFEYHKGQIMGSWDASWGVLESNFIGLYHQQIPTGKVPCHYPPTSKSLLAF